MTITLGEAMAEKDEPASVSGRIPRYTGSLDASLPGENIVFVERQGDDKWVAVQENPDGSHHEAIGNTEALARRSAALRGITAQQGSNASIVAEQETPAVRYLRWKKDLRFLLRSQQQAVDVLIHELLERQDPPKSDNSSLLLMVQAIGMSLGSIYALSKYKSLSIRDTYSVGRSVLETSINAAYMVIGGPNVTKKAEQHALQKYYRNLGRESTIGLFRYETRWSGTIDRKAIDGLDEALAAYTDRRGKEVREWTPESVDERIALISEKSKEAGLLLGAARHGIYRQSSEILHGTLFGVRSFWLPSLTSTMPINGDEMTETLFEQFLTVFLGTYFAVDALLLVCEKMFYIKTLGEMRSELESKLRSFDFLKETASHSPDIHKG